MPSITGQGHEFFMAEALKEAIKAAGLGEVPVGAVVVAGGTIIGRGHNLRETRQDPTAHAEIIALQAAARHLKSWRLDTADMYVTLEPCPMCAGALVLARVNTLYYATADPKSGAAGSIMNILENDKLNHQVRVVGGLLAQEARELLQDFFRGLRKKAATKPTCTEQGK